MTTQVVGQLRLQAVGIKARSDRRSRELLLEAEKMPRSTPARQSAADQIILRDLGSTDYQLAVCGSPICGTNLRYLEGQKFRAWFRGITQIRLA